MPKAKILVLTTSYPSHEHDPSSVFIARLLAAIKRRGYDLAVIAPSDGTTYGAREIDGIETFRFGYFLPRSLERLTRTGGGIPENLAQSWLARIQLVPMMLIFLVHALRGARRADLIYANWLGAGIIGAVASLLTGKPLVVSFRGDDGYLARDRFVWRVFTKWVERRASVIAPVSGELVRILVELGVPETKCRLPRFGVDTETFHPPAEKKLRREHPTVLFVGSLIPRKGLHDLLEALACPDLARTTLVVVGDGYDRSRLVEMADRLGLSVRIEWKGTLAPGEVACEMRSADILCLPSSMEGRPNVVNEAMASGLPVIATRIGGIPDMVEEGKTALLHEPGDVQGLRQCLVALVHDPEARAQMGRAGHEFLKSSGISWDVTAEDFDAMFGSILVRKEGR
ncbi:MAG: glycosyltransferase [Desulfomonile sp.]|nr:glycosyltransferase [Desulfomonile sp.]